jgi:hypothetical protein
MVVVALVAVAVAALAATGASSQLAAGLPDPVLRAAAVEIEAGSKRGAIVAADVAVTYLHGPAPSTDRLVLSGYQWLKSREAGGYIGSFAPALGARIRCVSDFSDYILWEISDPLPADLQIPAPPPTGGDVCMSSTRSCGRTSTRPTATQDEGGSG